MIEKRVDAETQGTEESGDDAVLRDSPLDQIKWDDRGLVPAIVQDTNSGDVLMLAYMSRESLQRSLEANQTWFWSRSRKCLWHKGETSGQIQRIREIRYDCDGDTLLVRVEQEGVACHTGAWSCFYRILK